MSGLGILDARAKLAAALAPQDDDDPVVLVDLVDALEPPALMLGWGEPWLTPKTGCFYDGRLVVTCVAGRLMPAEGVATLERLVASTLARLRAEPAAGAWPLDPAGCSGPRVFTIANINYLAARITLRVVVS